MKIQTTTKQLREGVRLTAKTGTVIQWESTGHLSVRLLDASGSHPLVARSVTVEIPDEGKVTLESDARGTVFHPDVPFRDYELDLGDAIKVQVPAVANRDDVQDRHVPGVTLAFVRLMVRDVDGFPCTDATLVLAGADGASAEARTDERGYAELPDVLPAGTYRVTGDAGVCEAALPDHTAGLIVVTLMEPGCSSTAASRQGCSRT